MTSLCRAPRKFDAWIFFLGSGSNSLWSVWREFYIQRRASMLRACLSISTVLAGLVTGTISSGKNSLTVIKICVCLHMESWGGFGHSSEDRGWRKGHGFKKKDSSFWKSSNHSLNEEVYSSFQRWHYGLIDEREIKASLFQKSSLEQKNRLTVFFIFSVMRWRRRNTRGQVGIKKDTA